MQTTATVGYAAMFGQFHPTDVLTRSKTVEEQAVKEWPNGGRDPEEFMRTCGERVIPRLRWRERG